MQELIIQVDENDNIIGKRPKEDFFKSDLIHRSSHLLLFNSKGQLLLQKRAVAKKLYPDTWDFSVGGTVADGETYEQALERETQEELGIKAPYKELFKYKCIDVVDKSFKTVYTSTHEGPFRLSDETDEIKWIDLKELKQDMKKNPKKYNVPFHEGMKIYFEKYYKLRTV